MNDRASNNGLLWLGAGLLATSLSSFVEHWSLFGSSMSFVQGLLDGLGVVAFVVGIVVGLRARRVR